MLVFFLNHHFIVKGSLKKEFSFDSQLFQMTGSYNKQRRGLTDRSKFSGEF
jgi:hypothetical protein